MKRNLFSQANIRKWKRRVRTWILRTHPEEKEFINYFDKDVTFEEVWLRMNQGEDFYDICSCTDMTQRELVFGELADLLRCNYGIIYDAWIHR